MEPVLQTLFGITGIGLFGALWYLLTTLNSKVDKSEQNQNQRFNDFKESQYKLLDIHNQKLDEQNQKIEKQNQKLDEQNKKFDHLIAEQMKITTQLTNHVAHLQVNQESMQKAQERIQANQENMQKTQERIQVNQENMQVNQENMQKDLGEIKTLLKNKQ